MRGDYAEQEVLTVIAACLVAVFIGQSKGRQDSLFYVMQLFYQC